MNMQDLQPHQQRVVVEKAELDDKADKLKTFFNGIVFMDLPPADKALLVEQHALMTAYSGVLRRRIERFEPKYDQKIAFERAMHDVINADDGRGHRVRLYTGPLTADGLRRATIDFGKAMLDEGVVFISVDDKGDLKQSKAVESASWLNLAKLARATAAAVDAGL